jgi:hypothetical protein
MREITLEYHKRRSDQLEEITGDQEEHRRRRGWWRWETSICLRNRINLPCLVTLVVGIS